MSIVKNSGSTTIGIDRFVYAIMTSDTAEGAVYGDSVEISGLNKVSVTQNAQSAEYYGDNGAYESASSYGKSAITVSIADIPHEDLAALTGESYDAETGVFKFSGVGQPPYSAIMYRRTNANGSYRYIKILKTKANMPNTENTTKADSPTLQGTDIEFSGINRVFDGVKEIRVDSDDANIPVDAGDAEAMAEFEENWFSDPNYVPVKSVGA